MVGASAYPRIIDFERLGQVAREVGRAGGRYGVSPAWWLPGCIRSPVPHAISSPPPRTRPCGAAGGLVLCQEQYAKDRCLRLPGIQGASGAHHRRQGGLLQEALELAFEAYQQQIRDNAARLAGGMQRKVPPGFGRTDNHLMLVDVGARRA